ncbi:hypothetical protein GCM10010399_54150 [Dactylosporangium fulvum]
MPIKVGRLAPFRCLALDYVPAAPSAGFDSWEQRLRHFAVPEDEWDDGAAIEDPSGTGRGSRSDDGLSAADTLAACCRPGRPVSGGAATRSSPTAAR